MPLWNPGRGCKKCSEGCLHGYLFSSLNSILPPIITTAVMGLWGMDTVIAIDLVSFLIAFVVLLCFILVRLFGLGKGSGAAFLFAILRLTVIGVCVISGLTGTFGA